MKFSIASLLLVFPTYILAIVLYGEFCLPTCVTLRYFRAVTDSHQHYYMIERAEEYNQDAELSEDMVNRFFSDELPPAIAKQNNLWATRLKDPWGNPYRFVKNIQLENGETVPFGVYSLGSDQMSESCGNDPDDLNTWDESTGEFYNKQWEKEIHNECLVGGVYVTMFLYLGFFAIKGLAGVARKSPKPNDNSGANPGVN